MYDSYLSQAGIAARSFGGEHMRRHVEERCGDKVLVPAPRTRKEGALVYCDTSKGDIVSALIQPIDLVQEGNESLPSQVPWHTTEDQDLYHASALPLRSEQQYKIKCRGLQHWTQSAKTLLWILFLPVWIMC